MTFVKMTVVELFIGFLLFVLFPIKKNKQKKQPKTNTDDVPSHSNMDLFLIAPSLVPLSSKDSIGWSF